MSKIYFFISLIILASWLSFSGCDLFDSGVSDSDPYDENCNLKMEYHQGGWKKYSDFDDRIPMQSRSYEAQQYYTNVNRIAQISAEIYTLERDMEIERAARAELVSLKESVRIGNQKNIIKTIIRMSWITYDTINTASGAGKSYSDLLTDGTKTGLEVVGGLIKTVDGLVPDTSSVKIDSSTVEGKAKEVVREGWMETIESMGDPSKTAKAMLKKAGTNAAKHYANLTDPKLSPEELAILRTEYLEMKRLDSEIQNADKRLLEKLWQKRALEQEQRDLKNTLFDLEYDEKERVDNMLIAECKRKTQE